MKSLIADIWHFKPQAHGKFGGWLPVHSSCRLRLIEPVSEVRDTPNAQVVTFPYRFQWLTPPWVPMLKPIAKLFFFKFLPKPRYDSVMFVFLNSVLFTEIHLAFSASGSSGCSSSVLPTSFVESKLCRPAFTKTSSTQKKHLEDVIENHSESFIFQHAWIVVISWYIIDLGSSNHCHKQKDSAWSQWLHWRQTWLEATHLLACLHPLVWIGQIGACLLGVLYGQKAFWTCRQVLGHRWARYTESLGQV